LPVAAPAPAAAPQGTVRVLLADDEEVVRRVSARILRRAGFEVEEACDGAEALQRFYAEPDHFDVVLLDLVMPVIDGEAAFVALRQLRPRQPVLLMSGYSKADVVSRAVGTGLVGFLRKPFTSKDLVNAIREVIDDAALHTAEGARTPADPQG
jgi:CheY-like chemotaxis protein